MTNNDRFSFGLGSDRSMAGSQQDRRVQAEKTRGFISAPSAATVGRLLDGGSPASVLRSPGVRHISGRRSPDPQLVIAAIFDCRISKIRPALKDRASWIDSDTGGAVHFVMLGHPCDSFTQGRVRLKHSGQAVNSLCKAWDEAAMDRGEVESVLASETHQLVEHFKLDRAQVPCLVFQFVVGEAEAQFVVAVPQVVDASELKARLAADAIASALKDAGAGWIAPESRAKGPGFAKDVVEALAKRLTNELQGIAGKQEPEQDGYVPTSLELRILRCLKKAGKRLVTREIADELGMEPGSIGAELANLRRLLLIDNERSGRKDEIGYGLRDLGRTTLALF